jgi:hypothetical protein
MTAAVPDVKQIVYGIFFDAPEPTCIYIGTTARPVLERFKEHKRNAKKPWTTKQLYYYIRQHNLLDRIYPVVLDERTSNTTGEWEDWWMEQFTTLGHPLQNAKRGNKTLTSKSSELDKLFKTINRKMEAELGLR